MKKKAKTRKHAQAGIIAAVLLILIVIAVAAVIASFAFNFNKQNSSETLPGLNYNAKIDSIDLQDSLASLPPLPGQPSSGQMLAITITRIDNEEEVKGIRFILEDNNGNSYSYDINDPPEETGLPKTYYIDSLDVGIDLSEITKVSISFILKNNKSTNLLDEKEI